MKKSDNANEKEIEKEEIAAQDFTIENKEEEEDEIKKHLNCAVLFLGLSFAAVFTSVLLIATSKTTLLTNELAILLYILITATLNSAFFILGVSHLLHFFQELHKPTKVVAAITGTQTQATVE
jgi:hypothetical protein